MTTENQQSEFNDAMGTIGRMNALFYVADEAAMKLDAYQWYHTLRTLTRELKTDMKKGTPEKIKTLIGQIDEEMPEFLNNARKGLMEIKQELYDALDELECTLREVHDEAGYKTKRADDPRFAL